MVSFQCHKCSDVVKKPKLNQHHSFCHAPFDCIDCSTTFHSPAEYQGHTSCMTEAEKYQKSLYKRPNTGSGWGALPRENGRGGFQGRGGHQGRPPRREATGANGTPLGTPQRMSPVTTPPVPEQLAVPTKPINDHPSKGSAPETGEINAEKKSKSKSKKDKKMSGDPLPLESSPKPSSPKAEKKKKEKRGAAVEDNASESQVTKGEEGESLSRSKKRERNDGIVDAGGGDTKDKRRKKSEASPHDGSTVPLVAPVGEMKTKKRKRDKPLEDLDVTPADALSVVPTEKKKKHKKSSADAEASTIDVDVPPLAPGAKKEKKKTKKDKRKDSEDAGRDGNAKTSSES